MDQLSLETGFSLYKRSNTNIHSNVHFTRATKMINTRFLKIRTSKFLLRLNVLIFFKIPASDVLILLTIKVLLNEPIIIDHPSQNIIDHLIVIPLSEFIFRTYTWLLNQSDSWANLEILVDFKFSIPRNIRLILLLYCSCFYYFSLSIL